MRAVPRRVVLIETVALIAAAVSVEKGAFIGGECGESRRRRRRRRLGDGGGGRRGVLVKRGLRRARADHLVHHLPELQTLLVSRRDRVLPEDVVIDGGDVLVVDCEAEVLDNVRA